MEAVLRCAERDGLRRTSLEDLASEAEVSRATIYRYFPGGRLQVFEQTATWEVGRFFRRLYDEVADSPDLPTLLERGLQRGREDLQQHHILQRLLASEPEELLSALAGSEELVKAVVRDHLRGVLDHHPVREGVDLDLAADYLARMFLTYLGTQGVWDLSDPVAVRELVRTQFVAGIVPDPV